MAGYGDDAGFATWMADNGHTLPGGAPAPAILRQRGSAYIDGLYGQRFSGAPAGGFTQERAWPRTGAVFARNCTEIPSNVVPVQVVEASYAAAYYEAQHPDGLQVSVVAAQQVKREKVDVIETEYFASSGNLVESVTPLLSAVEGLLAPFCLADLPATILSIRSIGA